MTGQVKEEILTRFSELGICIQNGILQFIPHLLRRCEFLSEQASFGFYDVHGSKQSLLLRPGELAFTFCQTPVVYQLTSDQKNVEIVTHDQQTFSFASATLPEEWSSSVFLRAGKIHEIRVSLTADDLLDS
jgi:hypothetical protein